jgi:hypothetical protein
MRQDLVSQLKNLGESSAVEPMVYIICYIGLQQAGVGGVVQGPTTIDEPLSDMANFRDVKVRRNLIAIGQEKKRKSSGVESESRF